METTNGKKVHKTVKSKVDGDMKQLKEKHIKQVEQIAKHLFNTSHQHNICTTHRDNLQNHETFIHVDLVENWWQGAVI